VWGPREKNGGLNENKWRVLIEGDRFSNKSKGNKMKFLWRTRWVEPAYFHRFLAKRGP
jgi:hypothetical protein